MLLGRMLQETRRRSPDRTALWFGSRSWTHADLDDATDRMAAALSGEGVRPGDRVALFLPHCPEILVVYATNPPSGTRRPGSVGKIVELPFTGTGKVDRHALHARVLGEQG